jgi:hypothetical protein
MGLQFIGAHYDELSPLVRGLPKRSVGSTGASIINVLKLYTPTPY